MINQTLNRKPKIQPQITTKQHAMMIIGLHAHTHTLFVRRRAESVSHHLCKHPTNCLNLSQQPDKLYPNQILEP